MKNEQQQIDIEEAIASTYPPGFLDQKAGAIRALADVVSDIFEIGRHLSDARAACAYDDWAPWLEKEFGWSDRTALNYMRHWPVDDGLLSGKRERRPFGSRSRAKKSNCRDFKKQV